jgi:hypothetical protein
MERIKFQCGGCRQVLSVGAERAGRPVKCPRCGIAIRIPGQSAPNRAKQPTQATPKPRGKLIFDDDAPDEAPKSMPARPARPAPVLHEDNEVTDVVPIDEPPVRGHRSSRDAEDSYDEDERRRRRTGAQDDAEDYPPRRGRASRDEVGDQQDRGSRRSGPWAKARVALLIVAIAGCGLAAAQVCQILADLFLALALSSGSGGGAIGVFTKIGVITGSAAAVGLLIGYVFLLFAPNRGGSLPLAIAVLVLGGVNLVLGVIFKVIPAFKTVGAGGFAFSAAGGGEVGALIFAVAVHLLFGAEFIVFPLFMRAISQQLGLRSSGWTINILLAGASTALLVVTDVVLLIAAKNASQGMFWAGLVLRCLADLIFAGYLTCYILLLFRGQGEMG